MALQILLIQMMIMMVFLNDDAFPLDSSESLDADGDGIGNNADTDDDNDGVPDNRDPFSVNGVTSTASISADHQSGSTW